MKGAILRGHHGELARRHAVQILLVPLFVAKDAVLGWHNADVVNRHALEDFRESWEDAGTITNDFVHSMR